MTTQVQAEGTVNQTQGKTGFWALYGTNGANSTSTATEVCLAWGRHLLGTTLVFYEFLGTEQNADYYASLGVLNCIFRDTTTGVVAPNGGIFPVTRGVCPPNSTPGSPCTCNTNFKPDPTLTSCIPMVQYTIALHNLNVGCELAPNASRAAYAQVMEGRQRKAASRSHSPAPHPLKRAHSRSALILGLLAHSVAGLTSSLPHPQLAALIHTPLPQRVMVPIVLTKRVKR